MTTATDRFNAAFTRAYSALNAEPEFRYDGKGRKVRVFSKDAPLTRDCVRSFYYGVRVVDEEECLETLGYNGFRTQVNSGNLVKRGSFYWVTKRAGKHYNLPKPTAGGVVCEFAEV